MVDFVNALGTWVEESVLKQLREAPCFSIMADTCAHDKNFMMQERKRVVTRN